MKLSVITITCRPEPAFDLMATAIASSLMSCSEDVDLEWIVVDEKLWDAEPDARVRSLKLAASDACLEAAIVHVPPKPSRLRGPFRDPELPADLPDHNGARNTGLAVATGDFVLFMDDQMLITANLLPLVVDLAAAGRGFRAVVTSNPNVGKLDLENLRYNDAKGGRLSKAIPTAVAGGCFGAAREAFERVRGFDEAYGGQYSRPEIVLRLARAGVEFWGRQDVCGISLRTQKNRREITNDQAALAGKRNEKWWRQLTRQKTILPRADQPSPAELLPELMLDETWRLRAHGLDRMDMLGNVYTDDRAGEPAMVVGAGADTGTWTDGDGKTRYVVEGVEVTKEQFAAGKVDSDGVVRERQVVTAADVGDASAILSAEPAELPPGYEAAATELKTAPPPSCGQPVGTEFCGYPAGHEGNHQGENVPDINADEFEDLIGDSDDAA